MALSQFLWNSGSSRLTTIGLIAICSLLGVLALCLAWSRDSLCPLARSRLSTSSSYLALNLFVSLSMFWSGLSVCGLVGLVGCDRPMYWVKMPSDPNSLVSFCAWELLAPSWERVVFSCPYGRWSSSLTGGS